MMTDGLETMVREQLLRLRDLGLNKSDIFEREEEILEVVATAYKLKEWMGYDVDIIYDIDEFMEASKGMAILSLVNDVATALVVKSTIIRNINNDGEGYDTLEAAADAINNMPKIVKKIEDAFQDGTIKNELIDDFLDLYLEKFINKDTLSYGIENMVDLAKRRLDFLKKGWEYLHVVHLGWSGKFYVGLRGIHCTYYDGGDDEIKNALIFASFYKKPMVVSFEFENITHIVDDIYIATPKVGGKVYIFPIGIFLSKKVSRG